MHIGILCLISSPIFFNIGLHKSAITLLRQNIQFSEYSFDDLYQRVQLFIIYVLRNTHQKAM